MYGIQQDKGCGHLAKYLITQIWTVVYYFTVGFGTLSVKALANEDTLLRTHCCRHKCFPVCPRGQHLLRTQILCPGHKKCF